MSWSALVQHCLKHDEENDPMNYKELERLRFQVHDVSPEGSFPLHFVAMGKNVSLAEWLLDNHAKILCNCNVQTPLHYACRFGYKPMVQFLIDHMTKEQITQADIENTTAKDWALEYEHEEIAASLEALEQDS